MKNTQKITVEVSKENLKLAMAFTKEGITPTINKAIQYLAAREAGRKLANLRGKVKLGITAKDIKKMREDRDLSKWM